jgi:hypothetical protein
VNEQPTPGPWSRGAIVKRRTADDGAFPGCFVYPFFLLHMGVFGLVGFALTYSGIAPEVTVGQGLIAIPIYLIFYLLIFGRDEIAWMFINAGLGIFGIASQLDFILGLFGHRVSDYPTEAHIIPALYWIMYTFLLRHLVLDLFGARFDEVKRSKVEWGYVGVSLAFFGLTHLLGL